MSGLKTMPPVQKMLEEQGCLFVRLDEPVEIGTIIRELPEDDRCSAVPGPMIVVGKATAQEMRSQLYRYWGVDIQNWTHEELYYKVVAE